MMSVSAQLSFSPKEINLNYFECPSHNTFNAFDLTSCFRVTELTSSTGNVSFRESVRADSLVSSLPTYSTVVIRAS